MLPRYRGGGKQSRSRGACAPEFCQSQVHEKPFARKATRVLKWSAGRRRGRGPRHADGCCHPSTLRAWRAPQNDPLARTACFGRAAPPGAPPPSRSSAAAVDRRCLRAAFRSCQPESPAGVLTERIDSLCNGKWDGMSRTKFLIMDLTPQGTSARFSSDLEEPGHVERLCSPPFPVPGKRPGMA